MSKNTRRKRYFHSKTRIYHSHSSQGGSKRRDQWQKALAVGMTLSLVFLIIIILTPSYTSVKLSPGTPNKISVIKNTNIIFCSVNLTIRGAEAIPVDYLKFTINKSSDDNMIAFVIFTLDGTIESQSPVGAFTIQTLTNTSEIPYQGEGNYTGIDEETGNETEYNYGYGYSGVDLNILYNITYQTHLSGIFYAKLFVNSILHTYASNASISFTVNEQTPPPGGGGGSPPSDNDPPVANPGGPYTGYVNKSVTFSGSESTDDSGVTGYRWDWTNDGVYDTAWSTNAITAHSYTAEGIYTLCLQVKDEENLTDSATTTVNVTSTTSDIHAPVARAAGPYSGLTYQKILFDGAKSYGISANITSYLWSFGDGTYEYNVTATHVYETAGTFDVVLTVTDSNNLIAIDMTTATIDLDANRNNISDEIDEAIGVDITPDDLHAITIAGSLCYLVDIDHNGIFDTFYNSDTKIKTTLGQEEEKLLIDINGDGKWEYIYDPAYDTFAPYEYENQTSELPWTSIGIIVVIVAIIAVVVVFYLRKNCYL